MHLWRWILELTGSQDSSSKAYNFWSGFGGDLAFVLAPLALWRKHNCGTRWCWRIAHHDWADEAGVVHHLCRKHHPDHPGKPIKASEIFKRRAHRESGDLSVG